MLLVNDEKLPNSSLVHSHTPVECNIWVTSDKESKWFKVTVRPTGNRMTVLGAKRICSRVQK